MVDPKKLYLYVHGLAEGLSHREIAERAHVSVRTVYNWRRDLILSMGCKTLYQAVMLLAVDLGKMNYDGQVPAARAGARPSLGETLYNVDTNLQQTL